MKILFFHSVNDLYGASRSLLRMASCLARDGHCVHTILPKDGPLTGKLQAANVEVALDPSLAYMGRQEFRDWKSILYFPICILLSCLRTARYMHRLRPDLIHSNTSLILSGGIVSRIYRTPHILHVREIFSEFRHIWPIYQWYLYFFSDCILCNSWATAQQFGKFIRTRKVRVVYNGYPVSEFSPPSPERVRRFRARFTLNGDKLVGLVGRIRLGRKGQDVFLKAAALLRPKFPSTRFLCIGSPFPGNEDHQQRLDQLIHQLGLTDIVTCTGDVDDIAAAYCSLDISVQASVLPESFGGVVAESMAMGKPVVATAIGGSLELVENGVTGLLVEPGDACELASALEILLRNEALCRQLGSQARRRFLERLDFKVFYRQLLDVYASYARHNLVHDDNLPTQS